MMFTQPKKTKEIDFSSYSDDDEFANEILFVAISSSYFSLNPFSQLLKYKIKKYLAGTSA